MRDSGSQRKLTSSFESLHIRAEHLSQSEIELPRERLVTTLLLAEVESQLDWEMNTVRSFHANDRATMLNLMIGLNGYTLCSGLICEELNGSDYRAVPFRNDGRFDDSQEENQMEIGYVTRKKSDFE